MNLVSFRSRVGRNPRRPEQPFAFDNGARKSAGRARCASACQDGCRCRSAIIVEALAGGPLSAAIRTDGEKLFIDYEATTAGSGYVAPSVMLEFGARSTGEPASSSDPTQVQFNVPFFAGGWPPIPGCRRDDV